SHPSRGTEPGAPGPAPPPPPPPRGGGREGRGYALFLLAGNRLGRAFSGACVGMGALAAHRQTAAVTQAAVASEIHQTLDVHRHFAAQIALDHVVAVDH